MIKLRTALIGGARLSVSVGRQAARRVVDTVALARRRCRA